MSKKTAREFDLIVYGAASFVGRLLTRYLVERHGVDGELKWALAGRNQAKLDAVAAEFEAQALPTIIADAADAPALQKMAGRAKVIVSTVGPYALFGSELVAACAEQGTDYCDLTGEPQWMRQMIDAHAEAAEQSGARIVHNCGFDSIPSDMGVDFLQEQAQAEFGAPCTQIRMAVKAAKGGFSGGTVASLINVMNEIKADHTITISRGFLREVSRVRFTAGVNQRSTGKIYTGISEHHENFQTGDTVAEQKDRCGRNGDRGCIGHFGPERSWRASL